MLETLVVEMADPPGDEAGDEDEHGAIVQDFLLACDTVCIGENDAGVRGMRTGIRG